NAASSLRPGKLTEIQNQKDLDRGHSITSLPPPKPNPALNVPHPPTAARSSLAVPCPGPPPAPSDRVCYPRPRREPPTSSAPTNSVSTHAQTLANAQNSPTDATPGNAAASWHRPPPGTPPSRRE